MHLKECNKHIRTNTTRFSFSSRRTSTLSKQTETQSSSSLRIETKFCSRREKQQRRRRLNKLTFNRKGSLLKRKLFCSISSRQTIQDSRLRKRERRGSWRREAWSYRRRTLKHLKGTSLLNRHQLRHQKNRRNQERESLRKKQRRKRCSQKKNQNKKKKQETNKKKRLKMLKQKQRKIKLSNRRRKRKRRKKHKQRKKKTNKKLV